VIINVYIVQASDTDVRIRITYKFRFLALQYIIKANIWNRFKIFNT